MAKRHQDLEEGGDEKLKIGLSYIIYHPLLNARVCTKITIDLETEVGKLVCMYDEKLPLLCLTS